MEALIIVEDDADEINIDETEYILQNTELIRQIVLSIHTHQQRAGYRPTPGKTRLPTC